MRFRWGSFEGQAGQMGKSRRLHPPYNLLWVGVNSSDVWSTYLSVGDVCQVLRQSPPTNGNVGSDMNYDRVDSKSMGLTLMNASLVVSFELMNWMLPVPEPCKSVYQEWRNCYILEKILQEVWARMVKLPDFLSCTFWEINLKFFSGSFLHSFIVPC